MKRTITRSLLVTFICLTTISLHAMTTPQRSSFSYSTQAYFALTSLAGDISQSKKGNKKSENAIHDFIESCKNRKHVMRKNSVELLESFSLLDDQNRVDIRFIEALKAEKLFDILTTTSPKKSTAKRPKTV